MVKNLIDAGIHPVDAVRMGSLTPACIVGEEESVGSIEIGKRANLAILDENWNLINVCIDGVPVNAIDNT